MKEFFKTAPRVRFRRNASWRTSALLGLSNGVYWAPSALSAVIGGPLRTIAGGLAALFLGVLAFAASRIAVFAAGLAGCLTHSGWGFGPKMRK